MTKMVQNIKAEQDEELRRIGGMATLAIEGGNSLGGKPIFAAQLIAGDGTVYLLDVAGLDPACPADEQLQGARRGGAALLCAAAHACRTLSAAKCGAAVQQCVTQGPGRCQPRTCPPPTPTPVQT